MKIGNKWDELLSDEFKKEYYLKLREFLKKEYKTKTIYPNMYNIFNSIKHTSYEDVKVVIIGQDPYHGINQAHGFSFSVLDGVKYPPSLQNIFKELQDDLNIDIPKTGNLTNWANQGVLLLNTVLTVEANKPNSHKGLGWEIFTDEIIKKLNNKDKPIVFLLWGSNAKEKIKLLNNPKHLVLTAPHPSPFSAYSGFFGCKHFSKANKFLLDNNLEPIKW